MSTENKAIARRVIEAFNRGDLDAAAGLLAPDYVYHGPNGDLRGPEGWKQLAQIYRSAFPDASMTIDDQIAEGDCVVTRSTATGTHLGELAGVAASRRFVTVPIILIDRIVNGRLAELWEAFDQLGMFQQIGTIPAVAASA